MENNWKYEELIKALKLSQVSGLSESYIVANILHCLEEEICSNFDKRGAKPKHKKKNYKD